MKYVESIFTMVFHQTIPFPSEFKIAQNQPTRAPLTKKISPKILSLKFILLKNIFLQITFFTEIKIWLTTKTTHFCSFLTPGLSNELFWTNFFLLFLLLGLLSLLPTLLLTGWKKYKSRKLSTNLTSLWKITGDLKYVKCKPSLCLCGKILYL